MKPFAYRGIWSKVRIGDQLKLYAGFIEGVSPRGMTEWYPLHEAIGITNNGFTYDGTEADYHEAAHTKGMAVVGFEAKLNKNYKISYWTHYLHQLTHISWLEANFQKNDWTAGIQYALQVADAEQNHLEVQERYYQPHEHGHVISSEVGKYLKSRSIRLSAAGLYVLGHGRFAYPKELGREGFFVSQPRAFVDGLGDTKVYQLRLELRPHKPKWDRFNLDQRISLWDLPDPENFSMNKYGKPSFYQSLTELTYRPRNCFTGMSFTILYVARLTEKSMELTPEQEFYNTNLSHLNFIINIDF